VTRSALQNTASVAGMVLATESMITESPQEKAAAPAMDYSLADRLGSHLYDRPDDSGRSESGR